MSPSHGLLDEHVPLEDPEEAAVVAATAGVVSVVDTAATTGATVVVSGT